MVENYSIRKKLVKDRVIFLFEVILVFGGIALLMLGLRRVLPFILEEGSTTYGLFFYLFRALCLFIALPLLLIVSNFIFESQKGEIIIEEDISPFKGHLKQYKLTKNNFKYQLLFGILLLFLFFIPLDFLGYLLIPEFLDYQSEAITESALNSYFLQSYFMFLILVIIIQLSVALYEETLYRGYIVKRGADSFHKSSAIAIGALYFGLMHFAYIFSPVSQNYSILFPFIFFMQSFLVAIILSLFLLRKNWIFPLIFAHGVNNIISAHTVWLHLQGIDFLITALSLYMPLLIISVILLIWQFPRIKEGISTGLKDINAYFKTDDKVGESRNDKFYRILIDITIGIALFGIGIFLAL